MRGLPAILRALAVLSLLLTTSAISLQPSLASKSPNCAQCPPYPPPLSSPVPPSPSPSANRHRTELNKNLKVLPFHLARAAITSTFTGIRRVLLGYEAASGHTLPPPKVSSSTTLSSLAHLDETTTHFDDLLNRTIQSLENVSTQTVDVIEKSLNHIDPNGTVATIFTSTLLSDDSAVALSQIISVIKRLPSKGVVNVFGKYPMQDVVRSAVSMSRLQNLVGTPQSTFASSTLSPISLKTENQSLHSQVCHYSTFANAAYGWKGDLAFRFRFHSSDVNALTAKTGISKSDIVHADFASKINRPAFFIARDRKNKSIVLCVRGTLSGEDVLTDLSCEPHTFSPTSSCLKPIKAHQGMLNGAITLGEEAKDMVVAQLAANPGYKLVLVGHSLGAGIVAILGTIWLKRGTFTDLVVYAYGPPCLAPFDHSPTGCSHIVSVVADGDPFATLSLGHLKDATVAVDYLAARPGLRAAIDRCWEYFEPGRRADSASARGREARGAREARERNKDLDLCVRALRDIQKQQGKNKTYRCFPPGIIYELNSKTGVLPGAGQGREVQLRRVLSLRRYEEIAFRKNAFDITNHIPILYELALNDS